MARQPRKMSSTGIYHIVTRGINKEPIFLEDRDYSKYLSILSEVQEITEVEIYAYCLMHNHVHLLIRDNVQYPIWDIMKRINIRFAMWHNYQYDRVGHFFQGRYRSEAVEDDIYFATVFRYIHRNPVKARIVKGIEDYRWTSLSMYQLHYTGRKVWLQTELGGRFWKSYTSMLVFLEEDYKEKCLELVDDSMTDEILLKIIEESYDIKKLIASPRDVRDKAVLDLLGKTGVSHRQLARTLCISRSMIDRAVARKKLRHKAPSPVAHSIRR